MNNSSEFSRPIDTLRLRAGGGTYEIAATSDECVALAERFGLLALARLEAEVTITPLAGGFYRLAATMEAALAQACTVTSEPVESRIVESFTLVYGPVEEEGEIVVDAERDLVEPLDDGMIDIGEAVAQQLSLALDPFPRAPGVPAENEPVTVGDAVKESPFAALAKLQKPGKA